MVGERLKAARLARGLSQKQLGEMSNVSAMAISKYERGLNVPGSGVLLRLAQALGVRVEYFFRPIAVELSGLSYRCRSSLSGRREESLKQRIQEWLERYLELENFFPPDRIVPFEVPPELDRRVATINDVERVAEELRRAWDLGLAPIENLTELLEDHGVKVGIFDGEATFDACIVWANETIPVIVVKRGLPGDRQRFNLAHELGQLVIEPQAGVDKEKASLRFAGSFLVPKQLVYRELGRERDSLHIYELHLLKHKYGLSMQSWIYRAKDLGILSDRAAGELFREFRRKGWHLTEPGDPLDAEEPTRLERLVAQALSEEMISELRAVELLGKPLEQFWQEVAEEHHGLPVAMRH